jgi:AmmeMemoRadiSam system protein B
MSGAGRQRAAELAGTWYPATAAGCAAELARFAAQAVPFGGAGPLRAAIVPHAGWVYSGAIAHNAIAELARSAGAVDTVVLFAGHMRPAAPATVMARGSCWTPLGELDTDEELALRLAAACPGTRAEGPDDHTQDNSFEVQLPLIKHCFAGARLLAVGAPPSAASLELARALVDAGRALGRALVFLGSTDLTHYGPNYAWAPRGTGAAAEAWVRDENDARLIETVVRGEPAEMIALALAQRSACCPGAAAAAVSCARRLGAGPGTLLRYATSAEIHPATSFVGYAGIVL